MTDEVRKAAERVAKARRAPHKAGLFPWEVADVYPQDAGTIWMYVHDLEDIADSYLSEHPADDDEPVTEEWWRTVADNGGLHLIITDEFLLCYGQEGRYYGMVLSAEGNERPCDMYSVYMPHIRTRGDVRRLCRALGLKVKDNERY